MKPIIPSFIESIPLIVALKVNIELRSNFAFVALKVQGKKTQSETECAHKSDWFIKIEVKFIVSLSLWMTSWNWARTSSDRISGSIAWCILTRCQEIATTNHREKQFQSTHPLTIAYEGKKTAKIQWIGQWFHSFNVTLWCVTGKNNPKNKLSGRNFLRLWSSVFYVVNFMAALSESMALSG